jgi:hypothetical protein
LIHCERDRVRSRLFQRSYDHVYYDVNNVIYTLLGKNQSSSEELFYVRLYRDIDAMFKASKPRHSLFLAVDGPGPRAKVATQLVRRRKGHVLAKELQRIGFTPGTGLMYRLQQALLVFAATRASLSRNKNLAVWVSGSDCAGEGENKCFQHMRRVPANHVCLVVGSDSDLIAYALRAHCEVHIMRAGSGKNPPVLLNVKVLRERLASSVGAEAGDENRVADDFILLSLMSGNDYVPGLMSYDFKMMWAAYKSVKRNGSPEFCGKFVFDAKTRVVNWPMLVEILGRVGKNDPDFVLDEGPCQGRLNPRQLINELLAQGGDEAVFEVDAQAPQHDGMVVAVLTGARSRVPFTISGKGRNQRLAFLDAGLNALTEGSAFLAHFNDNEDYTEESLQKMDKVLGLLYSKKDEVVRFFRRQQMIAADYAFAPGCIPGRTLEIPPDAARPPKPPTAAEELYVRYLEGLVWSFEMYGGSVKNFGYHFPYQDRFTLARLCRAAPQLSEDWDTLSRATPPLSPLALGLCLLGDKARNLLPAPFSTLEPEKDPKLANIFRDDREELLSERERLTENLDSVEEYVQRVGVEQKEKLTPEAKHLLKLHDPTCFMDRTNALLRTFTRKEIDAFLYMPPTMPKLRVAYATLQDSPPSSRIVAASHVPKTAKGHWFRFGLPHMQTRKFSILKTLLRK